MADLRTRFGKLVAAHRRRQGLTQEALAAKAAISVEMVSKIEGGTTGVGFPVIERLAAALEVDPAELFTTDLPDGAINRGTFADITLQLSALSEAELVWIKGLLDAAMRRGRS